MAGPSALTRQGIAPWTIAASIGAHVVLGGGLLVAELWFGERAPKSMVPEHTMVMLSAGSLPKQQSILPERPTRTPDAPEVVKAEKEAPPPPPKESELKVPDKKPEPEKGKEVERPKDRTRDREALLRKAKKEALTKDPTAAIGDRDQARTSPDGTASGPVGEASVASDPETAAWWKAAKPDILGKWVIVEADRRSHGGASILVHVRILPDGTLKDPKVVKGSGSSSLDRAAVMAIYKAGRVKPPPEKLRASFDKVGFNIKFDVPTS
jgi:protein TonB